MDRIKTFYLRDVIQSQTELLCSPLFAYVRWQIRYTALFPATRYLLVRVIRSCVESRA